MLVVAAQHLRVKTLTISSMMMLGLEGRCRYFIWPLRPAQQEDRIVDPPPFPRRLVVAEEDAVAVAPPLWLCCLSSFVALDVEETKFPYFVGNAPVDVDEAAKALDAATHDVAESFHKS